MNYFSKEKIVAYMILAMEAVFYACLLGAADKDHGNIKGMADVLTLKYLDTLIVWGTIFMIPLTILYFSFLNKSLRTTLIRIVIIGLIVSAYLQTGVSSYFDGNHFLWYFYRAFVVMVAFSITVLFPVLISKAIGRKRSVTVN